MKKSYLIGGPVLLVLIGLGIYLFFAAGRTQDVQYRFDKVLRGDIQMVVTATGTLSAVTTVQVGTQVSGIISKINVDFNAHVKKNQVIAQIDPTTLQQSVRDADANRQRAQAQYNESKRALDRLTTLLDKNLAAQADYDAALTQFESNKAAKTQAEAQYERAQINLNYATIRAPIDGVVISRQVDVGQTVAASFSSPTLFTIANDLTKMQVLANVDESDIGRVETGQDVSFTVDAYAEQTFHGTVSQVRLAPVTVQNVVNYVVVIDVPNKDMKLMPGMTATVTVMVQKKESVLKVPTVALRFQPPTDQIEVRRDSSNRSSGDAAQDSARAARRRQFAEQGGGMGFGGGQGFGGGGGMDMQAMQRRMAARGIGRVWVLNQNKKLEPVMVRVGLSDGTFTEVT
ncbi:MAG TPA: efflux RND transporter periplasmic adaptor subunit, partial [Bacteroidota bacterium]|nr:efflux RND transporter periplasmic adaptor subunit [Bacteroidota bacterium]